MNTISSSTHRSLHLRRVPSLAPIGGEGRSEVALPSTSQSSSQRSTFNFQLLSRPMHRFALLLLGLSFLIVTAPLRAQITNIWGPPTCPPSSGPANMPARSGPQAGPSGPNAPTTLSMPSSVANSTAFGPYLASAPAAPGGSGGFNLFKPVSGNLHRVIDDLRLFAGVGEHRLEWTRYFNSRDPGYEQYFGTGISWRHSYLWSVINLGSSEAPDFLIVYPNGSRNEFADIGDGLTFRTTANLADFVTRDSTNGTNYVLTLRNGFRYKFIETIDTGSNTIYVMQGFWDMLNNWYAFTNDDDGRFVRVTEPAGRWLEATYDTNGYIGQIEASDGRTVVYSYGPYDSENLDSAIVLTGADYGDGTEATYTYAMGDWPLLVHAVDPKYPGTGSNIRYTYWNGWGFLKEEKHGETEDVLVTNNGDSVVYANGTTNSYNYSSAGLVNNETNSLGGVATFTYEGTNGFPATMTDELGRTTAFSNSVMGNLLVCTNADSSVERWTRDDLDMVLTYVDPLGRTNTFTRDTNHLVTRIDYPDSTYQTFTYNGFQQVTTNRLRNGGLEYYGYATNGLCSAYTNALGIITTYGYDALHRLAYVTNALGNVTSYNYNDRGQITKITHPDSNWIAFGYDSMGNKTTQTNELGKVWNYTYDIFRQITSSVDPLGRTNLYEYAASPNCCSGSGTALTKFTSPSGRTVNYEYDLLGRKVAEIIAAGTGEASSNLFQYDAVGNLTNRIDGLSNSWQTVFSAMNRPTATIDPLGRTNSFTYDTVGNRLTATRPDGTTSTNSYDSMNRLVKTVDPLNQTNSFAYNDLDQLVTLTDGKGNVTTWAFDVLGRQTNKAYADSNGDTYRYDAVGNLTNHVNGAGQSQTLTYDSRGRLLTTAWNDGSTSGIWRSYDAASQLLVLSNSVSIITNIFDAAGQLTNEVQKLENETARTLTYTYTVDGQRQSLTYPSGLVLTNDYTVRGQLASLTFDGPPPLVTYSYDLAGRRTMRAYENGVNAYYTNDNAGQLLALAHVKTNGGSVIVQVNHVYNSLGSRTNRVESFTGYSSVTDSYGYDSTDQLTSVSYAGGARTAIFAYDKMGNLTNKLDSGTGTNTFTANNLNQLTAIGASAITYDLKGNLTNRPGWLYTWNANNQLIIAEPSSPTNGNTKMTFAYDGGSRCTKRRTYTYGTNGWSLTADTCLLYSGWNLIEERDAGGTNVVSYVHGSGVDEIIAKFTSTNTVFYHGDAQNNTLVLTDANANVLERYRYEAFGLPSIFDSTFSPLSSSLYGVRHLFQGREWLAEVKLNDHRFRYYSPEMQRWMSRDPIEEASNSSLYLFVGNRVFDYVDPIGLADVNLISPSETNMFGFANATHGRPGTTTVFGHGNPYAVYGPNGLPLTPGQLVGYITNAHNYTPTNVVWLISCNTAVGSNCPARQICTLIPNPVIAPNGFAWPVYSNGVPSFIIGPSSTTPTNGPTNGWFRFR